MTVTAVAAAPPSQRQGACLTAAAHGDASACDRQRVLATVYELQVAVARMQRQVVTLSTHVLQQLSGLEAMVSQESGLVDESGRVESSVRAAEETEAIGSTTEQRQREEDAGDDVNVASERASLIPESSRAMARMVLFGSESLSGEESASLSDDASDHWEVDLDVRTVESDEEAEEEDRDDIGSETESDDAETGDDAVWGQASNGEIAVLKAEVTGPVGAEVTDERTASDREMTLVTDSCMHTRLEDAIASSMPSGSVGELAPTSATGSAETAADSVEDAAVSANSSSRDLVSESLDTDATFGESQAAPRRVGLDIHVLLSPVEVVGIDSSIGGGDNSHRRARRCIEEGCTSAARRGGKCVRYGGGVRHSVDKCSSSVQKGGLCKRHGGGARCSMDGCTKSAQKRGLCYRHGGKPQCSVDSYSNVAKRGGRCAHHGGNKRCSADGCTKPAQKDDLCFRHGGKYECSVDSCSKAALRGGRCKRHGGGVRCSADRCSNAAHKGDMCFRHGGKSQCSTLVPTPR